MRRAASSVRGRIVFGALAVLVLGWSGTASAEKKRVGVPKFDGPQEAVIRKAVMQALAGDGYDVVGGKELDATARAAGAELDSNEGFKTVAKELSISAFVAGEVGKKKAKLTIRNGADGGVSGEGSFVGATPAKIASDVRENFSRRLGSAVERGRAPAGAKKAAVAAATPPAADDEDSDRKSAPSKSESKPEAKGEAPSDAPTAASDTGSPEAPVAATAPPPAVDGGEVGPRALDLEVGLRGFSRSLTYNQDYYSNYIANYKLRDYNLLLGPAIGLHLLTYPAAFFTSGIATAFGAELNVDYAFGVAANVKAPVAGTLATSVHDFNGGVRGRMILGGHELSAFFGGGEHAFVFKSDTIPRATLDIPDTIYRYIRFGADARLQLAPGFTLTLNAAYRSVYNQGGNQPLQIAYAATNTDLKDGYFPYVQIGAIDGSATIGYQITPSIEARVGVDMRRYFMTMNSSNAAFTLDANNVPNGGDLLYPAGVTPGAATAPMATPVNKVAGGAIDQYWGFTIGAAYVFGGVAPGAVSAAPAEEAEPPKKKHKKKKKGDDEDEAGGEAKPADGDDE
jgi:hypothetical protein